MAVGEGRAGASLGFDRVRGEPAPGQSWLPLLAAILTLPFTVALAAAAISNAVRSAGDAGPHGAGPLRLGLVIAFGPVAALLLFAIARIRVHFGHQDGRWVGRISARLNGWELAVLLVALAVVAVFFGHLVADSWACANGLRSAC